MPGGPIAWRGEDDHLHTGARTALDRLLKDAHTESYAGAEIDLHGFPERAPYDRMVAW
ncbi:hypothetical protein [Streptomyces zagrosensis]|uniref:Uncharacterized protein n=1 Tax=Streptomyces zagrosensis TaxID=1042984 RepID=A0A7W9UXR0_9ACTN|nr:hypothetical protein [Streptomyces zagrosensis]MBB5933989.1 hypothetical protein [Streptomyces zagrosensis]